MDSGSFDALTKRLAAGQSRRRILKGLIGGAAAATIPASTHAQEATPAAATPVSDQNQWLFVVDFGGAEIEASEEDATKLTVTLAGIDFDAVAFTDRPDRLVQIVDPDQVAGAINDSSDEPLNAALVARLPLNREKGQIVVVLHSASFDMEAETLELEAEAVASGALAAPIPTEPGQTTSLRSGSLFIDGVVMEIIAEAGSGSGCVGEPCNPIWPNCCTGTFCAPWGGPVIGSCLAK